MLKQNKNVAYIFPSEHDDGEIQLTLMMVKIQQTMILTNAQEKLLCS